MEKWSALVFCLFLSSAMAAAPKNFSIRGRISDASSSEAVVGGGM